MENIEAEVKGQILTLKVDLSKPGKRSSSGKSTLIATSGGNIEVPGGGAKFGLNVYRPL